MEINWKKNAGLFLAGQALSLFGTMVVQYAIVWHITLKSQSGAMMTLFTITGFLPMFFISPFAGVWADRFNRKYIIIIADGLVAFFSLIAALFLIFKIDSYVILFICTIVRSLGQGIQMPAVGAFIPQIVPEQHLTRINGFQNSIQSVVALASPMLSGTMMTFTPLESLFFLDVITAAIGISIVFFLVKIPEKNSAAQVTPQQKGTAYFHDLKEGITYMRNHGYVLRMIVFSVFFHFLFAPAAFLTYLQVIRKFGDEVWRLTAIEIFFSSGMMLGGVLIGLWGGFKNRIYSIALACLLCGLLSVGLGLTPFFWLYLIIMAVMGISVPLYNTPSMVLLQTRVEPSFLGRVLSVLTMVSSCMMPMGMLIFGPMADFVSIDTILIVTGALVSLLSIPIVGSKILREAGMPNIKP